MIQLFKLGECERDNIRKGCYYNLKQLPKAILKNDIVLLLKYDEDPNSVLWFEGEGNTLYHTEELTKVSKDFLKSKKCKYLISKLKD